MQEPARLLLLLARSANCAADSVGLCVLPGERFHPFPGAMPEIHTARVAPRRQCRSLKRNGTTLKSSTSGTWVLRIRSAMSDTNAWLRTA
eukprot:2492353-Rhodomonas_salina.5